jgi:serine/threonine-protein kinase
VRDRLELVQEVLDDAVDLPVAERAAFVRGKCDDEGVATEVLSLLAAYTRAEALMPDPARVEVAPELGVGERVGAFVVEERIGAGGMGVVYRARDTALQREVALKTVSGSVVAGSAGWARLEREARTLAALNHPAIAAIHALERTQSGALVLVLEYVPGPTLADVLKDGPMPAPRAVAVAARIAEALAAAHAAGIVHRDLKPANIKLMGEAGVKLLDFGLAKDRGARDAGATMEGLVMGTASYMSPEQARGQRVDQRTDVWALGCVLFEMLAGVQAFRGETPSDCIAQVLTREPDWTLCPASTPAHVPTLLRRCLEKNPDDRWHAAADVRLELLNPHAAPAPVSRRSALRTGVLVAGALATGGGLGGLLARRGGSNGALWPVRFRIDLSPRSLVSGPPGAFAISPDGRSLLVNCEETRNKPGTLWLHRLDLGTAVELPDSQYSWAMCFSPDGAMFARAQVGKAIEIRRIADNSTRTFDVSDNEPRGMAWVGGESLVLSTTETRVLRRLDLRTGTVSALTAHDAARGEHSHMQPCAVPGGRAVLFTFLSENAVTHRFEQAIDAVDVATGARTRVLENAHRPRIVGKGTLVFARGTSIRRVAFNTRTLRVTGDSTEVATIATTEDAMPFARFDASPAGVLVLDRCPRNYENSEVVYKPLAGTERIIVHTGPEGMGIDVSRDERLVIVSQGWEKHAVVLYDVPGQRSRWLGERSAPSSSPLLSPDGRVVVFFEQVKPTVSRILIAPTDTSTPPRVLLEREGVTALLPASFSPDGAWVYFTQTPEGGRPDMFRVQVGEARVVEQVLPDEGPIKRMTPALSPDGALLAFSSTIGGDTGLYLARAPDFAQRVRASKHLGMRPQWSGDGRFLFYIDFQNLHRVEVTREPVLRVSEPEIVATNIAGAAFRVAPSGQGVYMCAPPDGRDARATSLEVITGLDWS